jgi:hypothetical protein
MSAVMVRRVLASRKAWRKASLLEALANVTLIMAYIWKWRFTHPRLWLPLVALILASQVAHRERAAALGFQATNFGTCVRRFGPAVAAMALAMLGAGLLLGTIRPIGFEEALESFAMYLPWGLFQQYLLNGYFLKRFDMALSRNWSSILASALFCVVHTPNWFLMLVTPVAAFGAIWVYRRYKNLYFLGLTHATFGFLLFFVVSDSVSHHLRVGPGWFMYR